MLRPYRGLDGKALIQDLRRSFAHTNSWHLKFVQLAQFADNFLVKLI
jgi:hypothetical protein